MTTETPGRPDMRHVIGDWDGERAAQEERDAAAYRELRPAIVKVYLHALEERARWADSPVDGAVARAVVYQSLAGMIQRAIELGDRESPRQSTAPAWPVVATDVVDTISTGRPITWAFIDPSRQVHPAPCRDCGRTHLNGEHVSWTAPAVGGIGARVVWEGCCDCWLKRTHPGGVDHG